MNYKLTGGKVLLYKDGQFTVEKEDVFVANGVILSGEEAAAVSDFTEIKADDKLIMPGLINMHTHAYMTVLRNYADDVEFGEWLFGRIDPAEAKITPDDAYLANLLAFAEMIKSGTTTYVDMHMFKGQSSRAAKEAGMRAFIGRGLVGKDLYEDGYSRFMEALEEKAEYESDRIKFTLAPHAIYTCSPKFYEQVSAEAEKLGVLKQTHLSESKTEIVNCMEEYGKDPVEIMRDTGFLEGGAILAHCVQMQGDDIDIIKASGSTVVTNPASNAKLGNGFAPISDFTAKGVNLCLGTDGTASNNTLNMFREMGLLSLIHKGIHEDPTAMPAQEVLAAVTVNAAKALGMEGKLGVIAPGACADLLFIDLKAPSMYPPNNIISSLTYSASGSEVSDVMIGGDFVMRNRMLLTIDMECIFTESKGWSKFA